MNAWTILWPHAHNRLLTKGIQQTQLIFNYFKSKEINITLALFKEG